MNDVIRHEVVSALLLATAMEAGPGREKFAPYKDLVSNHAVACMEQVGIKEARALMAGASNEVKVLLLESGAQDPTKLVFATAAAVCLLEAQGAPVVLRTAIEVLISQMVGAGGPAKTAAEKARAIVAKCNQLHGAGAGDTLLN